MKLPKLQAEAGPPGSSAKPPRPVTAGMKAIALAVALNTAAALWAGPQGGLEASAAQGRLTELASWWSPSPGFEGRWWWHEAGGGSAWVKAGPFQAGPLTLRPGAEGWRVWSPYTGGTARWGVGVDAGSWGSWAAQDPEELEAGAQARVSAGRLTLAAGADRTWSLVLPYPATGPWVDRGRAGVSWSEPGARLGLEATSIAPAVGKQGWWARGRSLRHWGLWSAEARSSGGQDPTKGPGTLWSTAALLGWNGWSVGWSGYERDPEGVVRGGWRGGGVDASLAWGPRAGWEAGLGLEAPVADLTVGLRATVEGDQAGWRSRGALFAAGQYARGVWNTEWSVTPGAEAPNHTVTAKWREPAFGAQARWKTEGLRLGWIGPGQSFELTLSGWF